MTDEIFDYFGGNSARKVEPLDESELFDDLKPTAADSDPVEESEIVDLGQQQVDIEITEESPDENEFQAVEAKSESTDRTTDSDTSADPDKADTHWDSLANSLGITPAPQSPKPTKPSPSPAARKPKGKRAKPEKKSAVPNLPFGAGIREDQPAESIPFSTEPVNEVQAEESSGPELVDDFFGMESEPTTKSESGIGLSDMFVPSNEDFGSEIARNVDDDFADEIPDEIPDEATDEESDDFAGFSDQRGQETTIDESDESDEFVEFEVKDLDQSPERETRRRRRRPSRTEQKRTNQDAPPAKRVQRQRSVESEDVSDRDRTEGDEVTQRDEGQRRGRPGKARRPRTNQDSSKSRIVSDRQFEDTDREFDRDELESRSEKTDRQPRRRRKKELSGDQSDQDKAASADDDSRREAKKRNANIPTWDDAINSMIEGNIQRHKSTSGSRGGRRRR